MSLTVWHAASCTCTGPQPRAKLVPRKHVFSSCDIIPWLLKHCRQFILRGMIQPDSLPPIPTSCSMPSASDATRCSRTGLRLCGFERAGFAPYRLSISHTFAVGHSIRIFSPCSLYTHTHKMCMFSCMSLKRDTILYMTYWCGTRIKVPGSSAQFQIPS